MIEPAAFRCTQSDDRSACLSSADALRDFGGARAQSYLVFLDNEERIGQTSIIFESLWFQPLLNALTEKYGKPSVIGTDTVTNRTGARLKSRTAKWARKDGAISLTERVDDNLDTGVVLFESAEHISERSKKRAVSGKADAKKL